jgi:hypothetical protein
MSDDERLASMLYGPSTPAPTAPDTASPLDELAKKFYGDPAPPAAPSEPGGLSFDRYAAYRSDFTKHAEALHDTLGVSRASREADDRAFVKLADDLGFDDQTMLSLHEQIVRGLTQSVASDVDADVGGDADSAAIQARNVDIRRTLRERLGEAAAADVIARTQRFIAGTPDLEQLVNRGALATRADVFLTIAQHVQDKRIR